MKIKVKDWAGRRARVLYDIESVGGTRMAEGEIMTVTGTWRSTVSLADDQALAAFNRGEGYKGRIIRRVERSAVALVPDGTTSTVPPPPPRPPKPKRKTRQQVMRALERIQVLIGDALGDYNNDRQPDRAERVHRSLEEAFNLCLQTRDP